MAGFVKQETEHEQVEALFSVYLDGRASAAERVLVEQHLQSCADCTRSLTTLRATVVAVRAMPRVRAPRSFALPRSMAKQPGIAPWLYPALRAATAVATFLFVIAATGDLLTRATMLPVAAPASLPTSVAMERGAASVPTSAPQRASSDMVSPTVVAKQGDRLAATAPATASPTAIARQEGLPAATAAPAVPAPALSQPTATSTSQESGLTTSLGGATPIAAAKAAPPTTVTEPPTEAPLMDGGLGGGGARATGSRQPAGTPSAAPRLLAQPAGNAATATSTPAPSTEIIHPPARLSPLPQATPAPTQIARVPAPQPPPTGEHQFRYSMIQRPAVNPFRIAEVTLAMVAIALGVAAWVVRRRSQ